LLGDEAGLEAELVALIRQSIHVRLQPPQRITGTRSRGELYRLRFGLSTEAADEAGVRLATAGDTLRLVIKKGSPDVLQAAIRRYRRLPESLKSLFARHADNPPGVDLPAGYLIMQDLAEMRPLSEVLNALDERTLGNREREAIARAAHSVSAVLQALHQHDRRPSPAGHHLHPAYLAPMVSSLNRLCQPSAYPELAAWLAKGMQANGRRYEPFDAYFRVLARFDDRLQPPALGHAHGDCHSRNLMLNAGLEEARLVDIETLAPAEDYLVDYGLLLEDLAVYQSLPYGAEPGRLEWADIRGGDSLTYPPFPQASQAVVMFQERLLEELGWFAAAIGDLHWRERLWLAVARGLLLLAARQSGSLRVEPRGRAEALKLVQVAYAECLRLLDHLARHLQGQAELPALPFGGESRVQSA
jgi:hypothetical protein